MAATFPDRRRSRPLAIPGVSIHDTFIRYERDSEIMDDYLTHVTQGDAGGCIAFLALHLYRCLRLRGLNHGNTIPFPLNQEDIADALGFTVVHINRILHQLRDQGLLKIQKHEPCPVRLGSIQGNNFTG